MTTLSLAERLTRDGYVFPLDAFDVEESARYRRELEAVEKQSNDPATLNECLRRYPNLVLPFVDEITRLPSITDRIAELLGPDLLVLDCPFFIKEAHDPAYVSWHQDLHYWGLDGDEEVTAWVALTVANTESGCMRFVAGSHQQVFDHRDTFAEDNLLTRGQEVVVEVDEKDAVDVELRAGQMSLHHGRVLHASCANESHDRRIGLAIRYIPARMRQVEGANMAAMLVRGEDRFGHFRHCQRPRGTLTTQALNHWREIAGARNDVMFAGAKQ